MRGRDQKGVRQKVWKRLHTSLYVDGVMWRKDFKAKPGKAWASADIENALQEIGDQLEKKYPGKQFKLVEIEPNRFNFVEVVDSELIAGGLEARSAAKTGDSGPPALADELFTANPSEETD